MSKELADRVVDALEAGRGLREGPLLLLKERERGEGRLGKGEVEGLLEERRVV